MKMKFFMRICLSSIFLSFAASGCGSDSNATMKEYTEGVLSSSITNCKPSQLSEGPNGRQFAAICAGNFLMGISEPGQYEDEGPQHQVTISKSFEMQTTEVTQAQWATVMDTQPSHFQGPDHPVEMVNWYDALKFIAKLNATDDGYQYRLPTEAEWEYAARAGFTDLYPEDLDTMTWYHNTSDAKTHPVATKKANAWGLYDMQGNVWEWTADWYDANYYEVSPSIDPNGASSGTVRVHRGGGWGSPARDFRFTYRSRSLPTNRIFNLGFRLVRTKS